jgi:hypothetical protein
MSVNKRIIEQDERSIVAKSLKIGKPGPFQIIESEVQGSIDNPINAPRRRYDCSNYETCLIIAAGLNWDSFTCRGCSGEYEEGLHWRARQEINKDKTVKKICELPTACVTSEINPEAQNTINLRPISDDTFKLKMVVKE